MKKTKLLKKIYGLAALVLCLCIVSCASILPDGSETAGGTGIAARERTSPVTEAQSTDTEPETGDEDTADTSEAETPDEGEETDDPETPEDSETEDTTDAGTSAETVGPEASDTTGADTTSAAEVTTEAVTTELSGGPVKKITVTNTDGNLTVGTPIQLKAQVYPADADNPEVIWSVYSGGNWAKIDQDGQLITWKIAKVIVKCASATNSKVYALFTLTTKAPAMWEGKGTAASPYLIKTAEDLYNVRYACYTTGIRFKQTADIDLSSYGNWTPIGYGIGAFINYYDGDGHSITGLTLGEIGEDPVQNVNTGYLGLFSELGSGTTISNLTLECSCDYDGFVSAAGILCGKATSVALSGVKVSGSLNLPKCSYVGGIAGDIYGKITLCSSKTDISIGGSYVGGIAGYFTGAIARSFADGNITGSYFCGGLVGFGDGGSSFTNCYSAGSVTSTSPTVGTSTLRSAVALTAWRPAGGLIGCLVSSGTAAKPTAFQISYCYTRATVNAACDAAYASSLVGYVCDTLSRELYVNGSKFSMGSKLISNYAVSTADEYAHTREFQSGYENYGKYTSAKIQVCKNITEAELLKKATFGGWDFKTVWKMGENGPELNGF